jgi:hypothetical protein
MATKKKKKRATSARRTPTKKRKKVKRGCGKRNWSRGGNAYWKCKRGKRRPYKYAKKKAAKRRA